MGSLDLTQPMKKNYVMKMKKKKKKPFIILFFSLADEQRIKLCE